MSSDPAAAGEKFPCTAGGAIARGRRRLAIVLLGLSLLLFVVGGLTWGAGRRGPAILAWAVALVPWTAWRMSGDLDVFWLVVEGGSLTVQLRRRLARFPLAGLAARRLDGEEIAHLERLATAGGVSVGSGGFDSSRLGEIDLYASDLAHGVLVDAGENRFVVTPDDPERFLALLATATS